MFAQTTDLRRNVAAMFFAIVFSTATVAAAVGPAHVAPVGDTAIATVA